MIELDNSLKRIAGIVYKYGWEDRNGIEPVGGVCYLPGPTLLYDDTLIKAGVPGYYSREEVDRAVEIMYGEKPARP